MGERLIRTRIRRSETWGQLAADLNVVIASNVGGGQRPASAGEAEQPESEHVVNTTREERKEVRDERE
jgi:hypothetical protein